MATFSVTYDIVTPESAEHGDVAELGFISENVSLREAIALTLETRTPYVDGVEAVEASEYPFTRPRWVTITNGREFYTGACESRSLHFPESITPASRKRIARFLGCSV